MAVRFFIAFRQSGNDSIRSEAIQQIVQERFSFFENWAILLYFLFLVALLAFTWFVPYINVVESPAILSSHGASKSIFAGQSGKLAKVFLHNDGPVHEGEMLAYIENGTDLNEGLALSSLTDSSMKALTSGDFRALESISIPAFNRLGKLQDLFNQFVISSHSLKNHPRNGGEQQRAGWAQSLQELKRGIQAWKTSFIISTPISGRCIYEYPLEEGEYVQSSERIASVLPDDARTFAELRFPSDHIVKLDTGIKVQLKLDAYPYESYGSIEAKIIYIPKASSDSCLYITALLDHPLRTSKNNNIDFKEGLKAKATVVMRKERLFKKIYYSVFSNRPF